MPPQSAPPTPPNNAVVDYILSHQAPFAVSGALLAIVVFAIARRVRGTAVFPNEKNFLQLIFGGVSVAQGLALLCLCFYPDTSIKISDAAIYIGLSALCTTYLGVLSIRNEVTDDTPAPAPTVPPTTPPV